MSDDEQSDGVGYGHPPEPTRFQKGKSGNPKGRPKGKKRDVPYEKVLGRKVVVRDGSRQRTVTRAEAFLLFVIKEGAEKEYGSTKLAREAIELADKYGLLTDQDRHVIVNGRLIAPGSANTALLALKMGKKLDAYRETAHIKLEPWLIQAALARLGEKRLTREEQETVLAATRTPKKVKWPDWWEV